MGLEVAGAVVLVTCLTLFLAIPLAIHLLRWHLAPVSDDAFNEKILDESHVQVVQIQVHEGGQEIGAAATKVEATKVADEDAGEAAGSHLTGVRLTEGGHVAPHSLPNNEDTPGTSGIVSF